MKKAIYLSILSCSLLVFASACSKKLPNDGVPFYLLIDSTVVAANSLTQGSSSAKIDEIWVEMGSQNLGVYEIPARIPVLTEPGNYKVLVTAGVKNKGINGQRSKYPFYESLSMDVNLDNDQEIRLSPIFNYAGFTHLAMNESFETANNFGSSMTVISDGNVFEGTNSGLINVPPLASVEALSSSVIIPTGAVSWIEFNYKSNIAFRVGYEYTVSGSTYRNTEVTVNAKDGWNKMYIELTADISLTQTDNYRFFINTQSSDSVNTGQIYIDNFKVLY